MSLAAVQHEQQQQQQQPRRPAWGREAEFRALLDRAAKRGTAAAVEDVARVAVEDHAVVRRGGCFSSFGGCGLGPLFAHPALDAMPPLPCLSLN